MMNTTVEMDNLAIQLAFLVDALVLFKDSTGSFTATKIHSVKIEDNPEFCISLHMPIGVQKIRAFSEFGNIYTIHGGEMKSISSILSDKCVSF